ncbi:hypothetical protein MM1S1540310_2526 [Mycobacteroides abscessus subsp. bolletii 1S-154-0310]|uniref:Uncharacterized protein n=3 Tax=Mycobacteroides abscessus TaxID=36809 RepID=A0A829MIL1_9MYCO|nr:hypothetical protein MASS_2968 [Mycobacteroides abscessus subsp. bolletii 50594]EHM15979.1 hypothetical protein MMAS_29010 [Mycobacteroides abscessus subsp. massiliense CCUG 48898 = JCM 15300]EIU06563.1 hypothetical protein MA5S0421_2580 [Mycobacteroides abscessus 5S-0421]EIU09819.1 hypothetical protein MA5S0304_2324 [Mycobacteroides abscessus 5S-0304]EIU13382.1 hypothetical protein MA5S0422_3258 [Mycobacteroides abscessus 5S-0422]EIU21029.1 hypothetical protein MA5S0708_5348 [Mycobacteroid
MGVLIRRFAESCMPSASRRYEQLSRLNLARASWGPGGTDGSM